MKPADPATDKEEDSSPDETIEEYVFDVEQPSDGGKLKSCSGGLKRKYCSAK